MLDLVLRSLDFYFYKIENEFEQLLSFSYFTKNYEYLILTLKKLNEEIYYDYIEKSKEIRERLELNSSYKQEDYNEIAFFLKYFVIYNFFILNIKNSININIHLGNFILLEEYLSENCKFLILPYHTVKLNYGYQNIKKDILKKYKIKLFEERYDCILFYIPYLNHEDILSNTALGHEIGHYIVDKYRSWKGIKRRLLKENMIGSDKIKDIISERINETPRKPNEDLLLHKLRVALDTQKEWDTIISSWVKEILSDIIGLKIFGLPFFFSLYEILFIENPESLGDNEHPPTWLRFEYLIRQIRENILEPLEKIENGISEKIMLGINYIEENFSKKKRENPIKIRELASEVIESDIIKQIIDEKINSLLIFGIVKEYSYKEENNIKEINELLICLREYITPNEIIDIENRTSKPAYIISILNASWFFYICQLQIHYNLFAIKEDEHKKKTEIHQKLNDLILKAIELSNIQEDFRKRLNEQNVRRKKNK